MKDDIEDLCGNATRAQLELALCEVFRVLDKLSPKLSDELRRDFRELVSGPYGSCFGNKGR